ncbi:putative nucleic acid-binding protein, contains PIN domain [Candidatus Methanoperedens nitroreducens]|uniref:Putative nucleic acid-binding protein, contains PIN domain n=1 Tax=Candidatus Methanoperedens nitratireducens TaxID=1392998 RepID=A0A062UVD0_9EURY|nr:type II toxin-antitoxin system VapC family toxin [Candidatus Methanoperedens nitroreducens]KCZ70966.1 putative nucleic acid-binding protein, contains PIN domain [Candidatus Methanoperedens nitroreducens]MDJ1421665.1 type II toxin-antitoxin system VapC family toxin [Candidatus Methanoperedens sp.]
MASFTLDTDIVIEVLRGNEKVIKKMNNLPLETYICITGLTVYELYKGTSFIGERQREQEVEEFIEHVEVFQLDEDIEKRAGKIYADLRKNGELISDADILIAATVLDNDSVLVTNNIDHFKRIKNLKIENWL